MKSVISLLLCVCIMCSLCACAPKERPFVLEDGTYKVSFDLSGVAVKGELNYKSKDDIVFVLTEPENLGGVSFSENEIKSDNINIDYSGLKAKSPVYLLLSVIADVSEKEIMLPYKDGFIFEGVTSTVGYKINFDCENAKILSIETEKFIYIFE